MRLDVVDLACRRGGRLVLTGVSFGLGAGQALVVTGRNGAGKSTLLGLLAGLLQPDTGTVTLSGLGETTLGEATHLFAAREGLKAQLSAAENLLFACACLGSPDIDPGAALERVGLGAAADLPAAYLSSGQRRRLMLARLLVARRPLWLLDEPSNALDDEARDLLAGLMQEHLASGGAIVAATHAALALPGAETLSLGRVQEGLSA